MSLKFKVWVILLGIACFDINLNADAFEGQNNYSNAVNTYPDNLTPIISQPKSSSPQSHNRKFEEVIEKLDNIQIDVEQDKNAIKIQLDDTNKRLEAIKDERNQIKNQLKMVDKELRSIDSMKKKIRNNIKNRENISNPLSF